MAPARAGSAADLGRCRRDAAIGRPGRRARLAFDLGDHRRRDSSISGVHHLYRRAWAEAGHAGEPRIAINTHAFVADNEQAADEAFGSTYLQLMNRIGRERGWRPSGRSDYEALKSRRGPLALGSPEHVAEKIVSVHDLFQPERYLAHMSIGAVPHRDVMHAIELFGTEVASFVAGELRAGQLKAAVGR